MRALWRTGIRWLVLAETCVLLGCVNTGTELDLTASDPTKDQRKIAVFYVQEAVRFRHMAQDLFRRVEVYERLFGAHSDWVQGTRLLAQSYEDAAQEQERTAAQHRGLVRGGQASPSIRPESP
ncbi:MAG: exported protein of unknown function [Nitrospira sp.]|nr:exported protein of unknown function [Nitrospira sp.]